VQKLDGSFKKNGRREPLRSREELVTWIQRKGEQSGFAVEVETLRTTPRSREYFQKNGVSGLHSAVEFQGMLTVIDPVKFRQAFRRGIGSAKAFGFGLLVIVPVAQGRAVSRIQEVRNEADRAAHSSVVSRLVPEPR
jgi:CRISPR system Cascade subunit CasE